MRGGRGDETGFLTALAAFLLISIIPDCPRKDEPGENEKQWIKIGKVVFQTDAVLLGHSLTALGHLNPGTKNLRYAPCLSDAAARGEEPFGIKNFAHGTDTGFMQMPFQ
jgi:hypothetical protein